MNAVKIAHVGYDLVLDTPVGSDEAACRAMIDDLVVALDMTVLMPTVAVRVPVVGGYRDSRGREINPDDYGLSLVCLIAESHIALHTWPDLKTAYLEISSCKDFDLDLVWAVIEKFGAVRRVWASDRAMGG